MERWLYALKARFQSLILHDEVEDQVDEELQFHIDQQIAAGVAAGLSPNQARDAALRAFGGLQQRREECRDVRRLNLWDSLQQDVRYAWRTVGRSRAVAAGAVLVLGLGIGANTAVFSVVNAVLIAPLPYPDPDRLVQIMSESPIETTALASVPRFTIWRDETTVFQQMAAWNASDPGVNLSFGDRPAHLNAVKVSHEYFRLFGAKVLAGRTFSEQEDRTGGAGVAVLSHVLWRTLFASDPAILGRTILLGGQSHEVIGVIAGNFRPDPPADLWLPLQADAYTLDHTRFIQVAARLKPGVPLDLAREQVARTTTLFRRTFPDALGARESFAAEPLRDVVVGKVREPLQLLTGAVAFVLLIACANAASLLLARASRRRVEIATRAALGAARERLIRQLLSESLVLALAGGALGLGMGYAGVQALIAWSPAQIPRLADSVTLDWRVLIYALVVSTITGIVFGLVPALSASRVDLATAFKHGTTDTGTSLSRPHRRIQSALVIAEMTLALVLLVGSGLMIRTFLALRAIQQGFDPQHVLTLDMSLVGTDFERSDTVTTLVRNVQLRLADSAGISGIAATRALPVDAGFGIPFVIARRPLFGGGSHHGTTGWQSVSPDYFQVFRIELVRGRRFSALDRAGAPAVAIVNQTMARRFWQNASPLNERIVVGSASGPPFSDAPLEIVGIVADVRDPATGRDPAPTVYVPSAQVSDAMTSWSNRLSPLTWVVRTGVEPHLVVATIEHELRGAAGGIPVARIRTMKDVLAAATARTDFTTMLITIFAAIALVLSATGMYALMAYSVQQRTQEIGIRIAFGASPGDVRNGVVRDGIRLALIGIALGVVASLLLTRVMVTLIVGITTWDPMVFLSVAVLLTAAAIAAAYLPARRATRVSPLDALRGAA